VANVRAGTTWFVDATGTLTGGSSSEPIYVHYIVLSPSTHGSGTPTVTLNDAAQAKNTKFKLATPNTSTLVLDFSNKPIPFFGGIDVGAISGATVTIILGSSQ
jgi:hypothetical protein